MFNIFCPHTAIVQKSKYYQIDKSLKGRIMIECLENALRCARKVNKQRLLLTNNLLWITALSKPNISDNMYRLTHGHFHIGLVIIPRPPYWPETQSRANMGRGMVTRPIWKCPCIKLLITYFRHLEKRHPYWPETKSRPILARANMGLDMEMIV